MYIITFLEKTKKNDNNILKLYYQRLASGKLKATRQNFTTEIKRLKTSGSRHSFALVLDSNSLN